MHTSLIGSVAPKSTYSDPELTPLIWLLSAYVGYYILQTIGDLTYLFFFFS